MILYSLEASFRIRWILMLCELSVVKRLAWNILSVWNATFVAPRLQIQRNVREINNQKSKYLSLWINSGYKNTSNRFVRFSTRQKLFGPINEEMRQASLHFTQKGKYRVLHDAVVSCGWLLLKSITLPGNQTFLSATLSSTRPQVMKTSRW
jgi:hypothetical protein